MPFTSTAFAGFFLATVTLYWLARKRTWQNVILLTASYLFYGWVHPWYTLLLGLSTILDYFISLGISRFREKSRLFLSLSLLLNLGVLAFFKYYNFFNSSLAAGLDSLGIQADALLVSLALPAGLSFYTLKKISYILDTARGTLQPTKNLVDFALYVSFFPQVVSGPIDRPQKLLPQIQSHRTWKADYFITAWPLLVMGLFKKIVVADSIKSIVDRVFNLQAPSGFLVLAAALGFTLQILADFSAYTDISRAIASLLGFETSENFRQPYLALTPSGFWNRWHITLSNFLRDYIFFPLRRWLLRKKGLAPWLAGAIPPLVTMFVSGIWHGAGWTYLLWGVYYGLLIVIYQTAGLQENWRPGSKLKLFAAWLLMFTLIVLGWFLFRAPSIEWAAKVLFHSPWLTQPEDMTMGLVILSMVTAYALPLWVKAGLDRFLKPGSWWQAVYSALLALATIIYTNSSNPDFIYFQF